MDSPLSSEQIMKAVVLVIDDNPDDRDCYMRRLKEVPGVNYNCLEAAEGPTGLRMIDSYKPDCVLLDYSLPGHNGLEVLKQIRGQYAYLPVILLTGQGNEAVAVQAIKEGADNYFVKASATSQTLHEAIREAINHGNWKHTLADKDLEIKEKAEALAASEQMYRLLVDGLHDHAICWLDPKGNVKSWNSGAERITDYGAAEMVGQNFARLYPDVECEKGAPRFALETVASRGKTIAEIRLVRKSGEPFWANMFLDALRDPNGNLIGFVQMMQDTTERRENKKRDEMFRLIVDNVVDYAIYMLNTKGYVQSWNSGAERIKKYREEEIVGRHFSIFLPEDERDSSKSMEMLAKAATTGKYIGEGWWARKNGERFFANIVIDAIRDYQGNLIGFSNIIRDITERRKMEAALRYSEQRNALAVQGLSVGLWDWNVVTDELYWSQRFKDIAGVDDQSFSASLTDFTERLHPEDKAVIMQKLEAHVQQKTPYDVEYRLKRTDGSYVWIHACGQGEWDENGQPLRVVGSVEDISERKAMDRLKDEFVAMVSHELRTPLTSIRGALGLVRSGVTGDVQSKTADLIQIAYKNSERLSVIINDILDIEKIESGVMPMNIRPIDIIPFLHHVLEVNQPFGDKFGVRFAIQGTVMAARVLADPDRLMQAFTNLLSNAAKFSPGGGSVHIYIEQQGPKIRFGVRDYGTGIPYEFRSRIFQKFSQADGSDTRRCEGTGLGLSIAKKIVDAMNGNLDFESELGAGTVFLMDLPNADQAEEHQQKPLLHGVA